MSSDTAHVSCGMPPMVSLWKSYTLMYLCGLAGSGGIFPKFDCILCILLAGIIRTLVGCFIMFYIWVSIWISRQGKYKDPYFLNQLVFDGMSLVGFVSTAHFGCCLYSTSSQVHQKGKKRLHDSCSIAHAIYFHDIRLCFPLITELFSTALVCQRYQKKSMDHLASVFT